MEKAFDEVFTWMGTQGEGKGPKEVQREIAQLLTPYRFDSTAVEIGVAEPNWLIIWFDNGYDTIGMEFEYEPITETYTLDGL